MRASESNRYEIALDGRRGGDDRSLNNRIHRKRVTDEHGDSEADL